MWHLIFFETGGSRVEASWHKGSFSDVGEGLTYFSFLLRKAMLLKFFPWERHKQHPSLRLKSQ